MSGVLATLWLRISDARSPSVGEKDFGSRGAGYGIPRLRPYRLAVRACEELAGRFIFVGTAAAEARVPAEKLDFVVERDPAAKAVCILGTGFSSLKAAAPSDLLLPIEFSRRG